MRTNKILRAIFNNNIVKKAAETFTKQVKNDKIVDRTGPLSPLIDKGGKNNVKT